MLVVQVDGRPVISNTMKLQTHMGARVSRVAHMLQLAKILLCLIQQTPVGTRRLSREIAMLTALAGLTGLQSPFPNLQNRMALVALMAQMMEETLAPTHGTRTLPRESATVESLVPLLSPVEFREELLVADPRHSVLLSTKSVSIVITMAKMAPFPAGVPPLPFVPGPRVLPLIGALLPPAPLPPLTNGTLFPPQPVSPT